MISIEYALNKYTDLINARQNIDFEYFKRELLPNDYTEFMEDIKYINIIKSNNVTKSFKQLFEDLDEYKNELYSSKSVVNFRSKDINDDTIKNINGTLVRISKIGSTPNFVITDDGNLLLQNRSYYELPKSGGSGNTSFYIIGIVVAILGTIVLIGNRYYASKNYLKIKNLK